jgi:hypothetical protein
VARTLERDWEAALAREQALRREHERDLARQPPRLSEAEQAAIRRLAEDVPALWQAASTTAADRQAIARLMLDQVTILVEGRSERAVITCHWAGGLRTRHDLLRPVARFEQLHDFDRLLARIAELRQQGLAVAAISAHLNAEGWRPPKRASFNEPMLRRLLWRYSLGGQRPIWTRHVPRQDEQEWTLQELADRLRVERQTVYGWLRRGRLHGRMAHVGGQRLWLTKLSEAEIDRLRSSRRQT